MSETISETGYSFNELGLVNNLGEINKSIRQIANAIEEIDTKMNAITDGEWMGMQKDTIIPDFQEQNAIYLSSARSMAEFGKQINSAIEIYNNADKNIANLISSINVVSGATETGTTVEYNFMNSLGQLSDDPKVRAEQIAKSFVASYVNNDSPEAKKAILAMAAAFSGGVDNTGVRKVFGCELSVRNGVLVGGKPTGNGNYTTMINLDQVAKSTNPNDIAMVNNARNLVARVLGTASDYNLKTRTGGAGDVFVNAIDGTTTSAAGKTFKVISITQVTSNGNVRKSSYVYDDSKGFPQILGRIYDRAATALTY